MRAGLVRKRRKPMNLGVIGGLLILPILFIGAAISIPVTSLLRRSDRKKHDLFCADMRKAGRTISSEALDKHISAGDGTLIREWVRAFKKSRVWWTPDNIYKESPHKSADLMTLYKDDEFGPFLEWCWSQYTSPETGRALLVESPTKGTGIGLTEEIGEIGWIDIPSSRRKR